MTTRMKWLVGILIVVVLGAALYFSTVLGPQGGPISFTTGFSTSTTVGLPQGGTVKTPGTATKPTTGTKNPVGYSIQVHGKTETITSTGAGVTVDAPINSSISQDRGVLSVRPPESKSGETLQFQKSADAFGDAIALISSSFTGTQVGFDKMRTTADNDEFNPGHVTSTAHIEKLRNLIVGGHPAVQTHITTTGTPARDFYLTWVRFGITNWYIVRTAEGLTPDAKTALDVMFSSVTLLAQ